MFVTLIRQGRPEDAGTNNELQFLKGHWHIYASGVVKEFEIRFRPSLIMRRISNQPHQAVYVDDITGMEILQPIYSELRLYECEKA